MKAQERVIAGLESHGWEAAGMTQSQFPKPRFRKSGWFVSVGGRGVLFYEPPPNGERKPFEAWRQRAFKTAEVELVLSYANSLFPEEKKPEKWVMW